jgi:2'-5' RNA ligase
VPTPEDPARPRLFYAVPLPDEVREAIRPIRDAVQASVGNGQARIRWVRIESLHLTLRFLGPTSLDMAPQLSSVGDEVAATRSPFEVEIAGAGAFPDERQPRTLWLGIERGGEQLAALAEGLATATGGTEARRYPIPARPFAAHLTLARTDGLRLGAEAARALVAIANGRRWSFSADRIVLFRSHLGSGPAWYEPIHEARLAGSATAEGGGAP